MAEYRVRGAYFESCNCDAICPCRMIGGQPGGRSTHGICFGTLSWLVEDGHIGEVEVAGLRVALAYRYDDDEPGSPWLFVLHVDERGDEPQRAALADVFLGRLLGPHVATLPWVRKASNLVEVRPSAIELVPEGRGYRLRVGESVRLTASRAVETDESVACIVPGYDRGGTELYADVFVAEDPPFKWELSENCAFASDFEYVSM